MSLNAEERKAVVEFRLEKAQRAYEQAHTLIDTVTRLAKKRTNQLDND